MILVDPGDARRLQILGSRVEHSQEAAHHHVVELLLGFVQVLRRLQGRNDGEVIRNLGVVEDALVRFGPALLQDLPCKGGESSRRAERFQCVLHGGHIVFRQGARIGARISQDLVLLVERLRER